MRRVLLKALTMYLWKKVTEVFDRHLAAICMWQLSPDVPLSSAHRLNPQGQQPGQSDLSPSITLLLLGERLAPYLLCLAACSASF